MEHINAIIPMESSDLDLVFGSAWRNKSKVWLILSQLLAILFISNEQVPSEMCASQPLSPLACPVAADN